MIILEKDVKIYDNREDSEVYAKAGEYDSLDDIKIYGVEPDGDEGGYYPVVHNFSFDYIGKTTSGSIIIAWDDSYGLLSASDFIIKE